jgi:hypothetical protein
MATTFNVNQNAFRAVNDNGSESGSSFFAALNTNWTQPQDANIRLRYWLILTTLGADWPSSVFIKFQYNKNSAGWNDITSSSSVVRLATSGNVTDETSTSQRITFVAGNVLTTSTATTNALGTVNCNIEVEACFQVRSADTIPTDSIQVRVVSSAGVAPGTITNTATMTVSAAVVPAPTLTGITSITGVSSITH